MPAGKDGVERCGELAGAIADEEPERGGAVVEVNQEVPGLLGGPGSCGMAGCTEDVDVAVADFEGECERSRNSPGFRPTITRFPSGTIAVAAAGNRGRRPGLRLSRDGRVESTPTGLVVFGRVDPDRC